MRTTALIDDMGVANVGFLIENLGKTQVSYSTCANSSKTA